jgi:hypothetical protein
MNFLMNKSETYLATLENKLTKNKNSAQHLNTQRNI